MKNRADGTPEWPPRPGELWTACESWPTYGFEGLKGLEILPDDVFVVIKACPGWGDPTNQLRKYVDLQVLIRGRTLTITSECFDGAPDMHQLESHETR